MKKVIFFTFLICSLALNAEVNFQNLQLKYLSKRDGLSDNNVTSVIQDQYGFLWIGTDGGGLNRYDGYSFLHFRQNRDDATSISSDRIVLLFEDSRGMIWIATKNSGLDRFDRNCGIFHHYLRDSSDPFSLRHNRVNSICEDLQGNLWFATDEGLSLYKGDTEGFLFVESGLERTTSLYLDDRGNLWVGGDEGFSVLNPKNLEILYYGNSESSETVSTILDLGDGMTAVLFPNKTFIYGWQNEGTVFLEAEYNWGGLSALPDSRGIVWIGGEMPGELHAFHSKRREYSRVHLSIADLPDRSVLQFPITPVLEDRAGSMWFASYLGISLIPSSNRMFSTFILGERVTGFAETSAGDILISGQKGVYSYFPDEDNLTAEEWKAGENTIILSGGKGIFYLLNSVGLYHFNQEEQGFSLLLSHGYDDNRALNWGPHINMDEDSEGNLWIGTTKGIDFVHTQTLEVVHYGIDGDWPLVLSGWNNRLWAGTRGTGLFLFDEKEKEFRQVEAFPRERVWSLAEGDRGTLWIGSDSGLYSYTDNELTLIFNEKAVLAVEIDSDGLIWFCTDNGLYRHDPFHTEPSYVLSATEGAIRSFLGNASLSARDGSLYFGGEGGFLRIDGRAFGHLESKPSVLLSSFSVLGENRRGERPIYETEELNLSWNDTFFAFEFTTFRFSSQEFTRFAYKLEGWDRDWIEVGNRNYASYTNIPGGSYVFRVRSSHGGGNWSDESQQVSVPIHISTHPLKTPWAMAFYAISFLTLLLVLFLLYHNVQKKKLERQKLLTEELNKVNRLKDEFLANTTHELRTPLHGIIGLAETLINDEDKISERTRKELSLIVSSGRRLVLLINDILDYSRLKGGDVPLNYTSIRLNRLVDTVLLLSKPLLKKNTVELINRVEPELPAVRGDISRVQQILHNLIGNAVKFTDEGTVSVSAEKGESMITVWVRDTGLGIPDDKKEIIWNQFQQADGSTSRLFGGSGLGLSITRKLVELHGGKVGLESQEGSGSAFYFTIPISQEGESSAGDSAQAGQNFSDNLSRVIEQGRAAKEASPTSGWQILYADDDPLNRHVMENQLRSKYDFILCSSGMEAMNVLMKEERPDLLLLDLMMPEMDGFEVCRLLRKKYSPVELPVIVITADNQVSSLVTALSSGANDYLSKPYSARELYARIENQLSLVKSSMGLLDIGPLEGSSLNSSNTDILLYIDFSKLSPDEDKSRILSRILPLIRENRGTVIRLEGDHLSVHFADGVDSAIRSARSIETLSTTKTVYSLIHGGINRELMLAEAEIFSDKTGELSCSIALSDSVEEKLDKSYSRRLIAFAEGSLKKEFSLFQLTAVSKEADGLFERAVIMYKEEDWNNAFAAFNQYLQLCPHDKVADYYRKSVISRLNS